MAGLLSALVAPVLAMPAAVTAEGPFLVIAAPWGGGAEAVVARAGGRLAAPASTPMAAIAYGAEAEAFEAAGALMVLAPPDPAYFCDPS